LSNFFAISPYRYIAVKLRDGKQVRLRKLLAGPMTTTWPIGEKGRLGSGETTYTTSKPFAKRGTLKKLAEGSTVSSFIGARPTPK
jgi:hypothetical protein